MIILGHRITPCHTLGLCFSWTDSTLIGFLRVTSPLFHLVSLLIFPFQGMYLRKQLTINTEVILSFTISQFLSVDFCLYRFASLVAVYVVGGFLYQRLVVGAKGMEQFPHLAFWQDLGNLVAVSNRAAGWICSLQTRLGDQPSWFAHTEGVPGTQDMEC